MISILQRVLKAKRRYKITGTLGFLFAGYFLFFTGPQNLHEYPDSKNSLYKLPWKAGVSRFVSQGNRSFTTHRGAGTYAWDFWMSIGTEVLAARAGRVVEIVDHLDGIGIFHGNRIVIEHDDGTRAVYAHLKKSSAKVKLDQIVPQGHVIGLSGMVGFTINPHLHFQVFGPDHKTSIPITFRDVDGGVPFAGRFYTSQNYSE